MDMINQLNEVFEGLNECTKSANTMKEVNAMLESGEIKMYFDEKTKEIGNKLEDEFDTSEEEYDLQKAKWIGMQIFECVKGMVLDNWFMLKER